jgi:3-oxoacyl-(acyl-carrier-protein) synthase
MDRKGINLAEGAAALCLESGEAAKYHALARIAGVGMATDSFHMTAPEPEGRGCKEAIAVALNSSGLTLKDISWIHAHGTGSLHNDLAEGAALCNLFKEAMPPVTSTKSIHGHSLGASGAIETVLCLEALIRQQIIKTAGLEKPDPAIPIHHTSANGPAYLKHILKLTLGFGGTNAALILSRPDAEAEHGS